VYGKGVQKYFEYGLPEPDLIFFDVYDTLTNRYLSTEQTAVFLWLNRLPHVPILYKGAYSTELLDKRNEKSVLAQTKGVGNHLSEGIVIESLERQFISTPTHVYRSKIKFVGEEYLLHGK